MKKLIIPMVMLASLTAFAGEKGNGGETVDVEGYPRLRDLVETTTCNWVDGAAMVNENPEVSNILKKVSAVDWYFAEELKQEILDLDYCLTGTLVRVDTKDTENLVTTYNVGAKQAAIRLNRTVYLDYGNFTRMPVYDRPYLLIHEAMHTYLSSDTPMRNQRLRSMVKAIESVALGKISTTNSFHTQMKNNAIDFPLTVQSLRPFKKEVLYVIGDYESRRETILKTKSLETFFQQILKINKASLASWHQDLQETATLNDLVNAAINQEDVELLKFLLENSSFKENVLAIIYSSDFAQNSEVIKKFMEESGSVESFVQSLLKELASKKVSSDVNGRIVVSNIGLIVKHNDTTPFTSVETLDLEVSRANYKLQVLLQILISALKEGNEDLVKRLFTNNDTFYRALEVTTLKEAIRKGPAFNEMERDIALRKADLIVLSFWQLVRSVVISQTPYDTWTNFASKIDSTKLGYTVK